MTYKNSFEPKDARIFNTYEDTDDFDDMDDWDFRTTTSKPRRRKTGTQALVDFLNTTGPDEFQKTTPTKKSPYKLITTIPTRRFTSSSFFLRRRNKSKSSTSSTSTIPSTSSTPSSSANSDGSSLTSLYLKHTPNTIQRKNYIEIVSHGQSSRGLGHQDTVVSASRLSLNELVPGGNGSNLQNVSAKPSYPNLYTSTPTMPPFDTNLIFDATAPSTSPTTSPSSPKTYKTIHNAIKKAINKDEYRLENEKGRNKANTKTCDGMDVIEAGLIQRLKQYQLSETDKHGYGAVDHHTDSLMDSLTKTGIPMVSTKQQEDHFRTKRVRHAQVQTLPCDIQSLVHQKNNSSSSSFNVSATDIVPPPMKSTLPSTTDAVTMDLRRQLEKERQKRQQLEWTLKETCDHFEILSELADRKLRELWEEKLRWEHACIDLNEDLMRTRQSGDISDLPVTGSLTEVTKNTRIP